MNYQNLLKEAYLMAAKSSDPSTQIGAFLINKRGEIEWLTRAFNTPTAGWEMTDKDWARPRKYDLMCHAERGSLDRAASFGLNTTGSTMVATWAACADCARGIVACGVKTLVRHKALGVTATTGWEDSVSIGDQIMLTGGVELLDITGPIHGAPSVMRSEKLYDPTAEAGDNWHNHQDEA